MANNNNNTIPTHHLYCTLHIRWHFIFISHGVSKQSDIESVLSSISFTSSSFYLYYYYLSSSSVHKPCVTPMHAPFPVVELSAVG